MPILRKYIPLWLVVVFFFACKSEVVEKDEFTKPENEEFDLDRIKKDGKLVAMIEYSSTSYFIYRGTPMGFEYDLLNKLADHLGVELVVKPIANLDDLVEQLNKEDADIAAANLTVTKERQESINFTEPHTYTCQVLVQRKPEGWRNMSPEKWKKDIINDPIDLAYRKVHLRKNSSFYARLTNLSEEIGESIFIEEVRGDMTTEELIELVARGDIEFTVADQTVARVNAAHYNNIYVETPISFKQQIAWAVRKSSPKLLEEINTWLIKFKKTTEFAVIYNKYFRSSTDYKERISSEYYSAKSGKISAYDDLVKKYSSELNWDWKLLSSLIYQESQFDKNATSWVGAFGLMQIMPETATLYGIDSTATAEENIRAGVTHLKWLNNKWSTSVADEKERLKFVLASYNVGLGHIIDARNLATKYGKDGTKWEDVGEFVLKKSQPDYYQDPVVRFGYCRGQEPFLYVKEILKRFDQYQHLIN